MMILTGKALQKKYKELGIEGNDNACKKQSKLINFEGNNQKIKIEVKTKRILKEGKLVGGNILKIIERKPFQTGFVGNFIPHWVRYNKKEYLLHGGIDSSYIQEQEIETYIEVEK